MVRELCRTILNIHSICFWLDIPGTILRFLLLCPRLFYASVLFYLPYSPHSFFFPCVLLRSAVVRSGIPINRNAMRNERQREREIEGEKRHTTPSRDCLLFFRWPDCVHRAFVFLSLPHLSSNDFSNVPDEPAKIRLLIQYKSSFHYLSISSLIELCHFTERGKKTSRPITQKVNERHVMLC